MGTPCGWTVVKCGCGTCWDNLPPDTRTTAQTLAAMFMWAATGRRYGACRITVQPYNPPRPLPLYQTYPRPGGLASGGSYGSEWLSGPVLTDGQWSNRCAGSGCGCRARCEVELDGPVADVVSVTEDGVVVDPAAYQVHNRRLLVRIDGACWPTCTKVDQVVPGFEVVYHRGVSIPAPVQKAFELLACEFGKACTGGACRLPPRIASLTRQGVGVQLEDAGHGIIRIPGLLTPLRTGIALIDNVIEADNPAGRIAPATIMSPDIPNPHHRYVTWRPGP